MWEVLLEMLGEVVQKIVQAPHERRVKQYLKEATQGQRQPFSRHLRYEKTRLTSRI
jgi:hypothetical protein